MVNVKEIILGIIIGVVLLMFLVYGMKLIYDAPEYPNCYEKRTAFIDAELNEVQEQQINNEIQECQDDYEKAREAYSRNMFIITLIISVLIIVVSVVLIKIEVISGGLMFGSLMFLIQGTAGYWQFMEDWLRFFILGIALLILIYAGYWLSKRK